LPPSGPVSWWRSTADAALGETVERWSCWWNWWPLAE
jgi:hypothetical protein